MYHIKRPLLEARDRLKEISRDQRDPKPPPIQQKLIAQIQKPLLQLDARQIASRRPIEYQSAQVLAETAAEIQQGLASLETVKDVRVLR